MFAWGALNPTCGYEVCVVQCGGKRSQGSRVGQAVRVWKPVLSNPTPFCGQVGANDCSGAEQERKKSLGWDHGYDRAVMMEW